MSDDKQSAYLVAQADFDRGHTPDLAQVDLAVLFAPYWKMLFSGTSEEACKGADGLLKYRALMEKGAFNKDDGVNLDGLSDDERAAIEDV